MGIIQSEFGAELPDEDVLEAQLLSLLAGIAIGSMLLLIYCFTLSFSSSINDVTTCIRWIIAHDQVLLIPVAVIVLARKLYIIFCSTQ